MTRLRALRLDRRSPLCWEHGACGACAQDGVDQPGRYLAVEPAGECSQAADQSALADKFLPLVSS
jgi:hypothetical protein